MSKAPAVSVIVVSSGRPTLLKRCLKSLFQLQYSAFEIVVVADQPGLDAVTSLPQADLIKRRLQTDANISKARNDGLAMAAGSYCAFLDDDAVAEPYWLNHLVAEGRDFVTGPVIGRNGFSVQWGRMAVSGTTQDWHLQDGDALPYGAALKLHGCNFMGRRDLLLGLGGFDEALRFFLDDSDLSLRVAASGADVAFVAGARVHHAFAASARRRGDRVPLDLYEIAASQAVFLKTHAERRDLAAHLTRFREHQTLRLARMRRARRITARAQHKVLESLEAGIADGLDREVSTPRTDFGTPPGLLAFKGTTSQKLTVLSSRYWHRASLFAQADELGAQGSRVFAIALRPTPHRHRRFFDDRGFWVQTGGLFGPSDRAQRAVRYWRFEDRIAAETATFGLSPVTT